MKRKITFHESPSNVVIDNINTKYINCTRHAALDFLSYKNISNKINFLIQPLEFSCNIENITVMSEEKTRTVMNGIEIEKKYIRNTEELLNIVVNEINNENVVFLWVDWYYVKGSRFYKKYHQDPHNALVVGVDNQKFDLCLKDRWLSERQVSFIDEDRWFNIGELSDAIANCKCFVQTFTISDKDKMLFGNLLKKKIFEESYINLFVKNDFKKMYTFSEDIRFLKDNMAKKVGTDLFVNYVGNRYLVSIFLDMILSTKETKRLLDQSLAWWKVVAVLWSRQPDLYEIGSVLRSIIGEDERLLHNILGNRFDDI